MLGTALTFNGDPRNGRALLLRAIELREQLNAEPQLRAYLGAGLASPASTTVLGRCSHS